MARNVRRRGRRRVFGKRGNWFTRLKVWQKTLLCVAVVLICLLSAGAMYVYAKWNMIDTQEIRADDLIINEEVRKNTEVDLGDGYTNVALFGVDSRDGNLGKGNRTDCIIVASLNNETKEIKMVSVYRDTILDLSEGTYQKCNAAYSYGGPVMAINMLNMNLDLDIEDYVTVDFGAIADAIDLLGGVEIEVKDEEVKYINKYIPETARSAGKSANLLSGPGTQLLDGTQATTYARIRSTAGGDFTRTERQRLVIEKMFEKALEADLGTINEIIDEVFPQVSTSFTLQEILGYAAAYSEYQLGDNMGFPIDKSTDTLSGLGSIVIPEDLTSNVSQLHEFLFGTEDYTPSSTVQTVNANIISKVGSAGAADSSGSGSGSGSSGSSGNSGSSSSYSNSGGTGNQNWNGTWNNGGSGSGATGGTGDDSGSDGGGNGGGTGNGGSQDNSSDTGNTGNSGGSGGDDGNTGNSSGGGTGDTGSTGGGDASGTGGTGAGSGDAGGGTAGAGGGSAGAGGDAAAQSAE